MVHEITAIFAKLSTGWECRCEKTDNYIGHELFAGKCSEYRCATRERSQRALLVDPPEDRSQRIVHPLPTG